MHCRRDVDAAVLVAAARVERAGRRLAVVNAGDTALVAGDARADCVRTAGEHLVRQVGVGEQTAADDRDVTHAVAQRGLRLVHVAEAAVRHDGHVDHAADDLGRARLQRHLLHAGGRHGVGPVFVAPGVHVQGVRPGGDDQLCKRNALVDGAVALAVHVVVRREFDDDGEVRTALFLADGDELGEKARAVFQAAAVGVGARVPAAGQKLVGQVAAVGVDAHAVGPAAQRDLHAAAEVFLQLVDLVDGQRVAAHARHVHPRAGGCADGHLVAHGRSADAPVAGLDLRGELAVVCMAALGQGTEQRLGLVVEVDGVLTGFERERGTDVAEHHGRAALGARSKVRHRGGAQVADGDAIGAMTMRFLSSMRPIRIGRDRIEAIIASCSLDHFCTAQPPSTGRQTPLMYLASSEHRYTTAQAASSGMPT